MTISTVQLSYATTGASYTFTPLRIVHQKGLDSRRQCLKHQMTRMLLQVPPGRLRHLLHVMTCLRKKRVRCRSKQEKAAPPSHFKAQRIKKLRILCRMIALTCDSKPINNICPAPPDMPDFMSGWPLVTVGALTDLDAGLSDPDVADFDEVGARSTSRAPWPCCQLSC